MRRQSSLRDEYIKTIFCKPSHSLIEIDSLINSSELPKIHIEPEEGKFLQFLIKAHNIKKIIELGTHVGYSTIWLAEVLNKDGIIHTIEKDPQRAILAQENFLKYGYSEYIRLHQGDALDILNNLKRESPFDMIFIDANKSKYLQYLDWADKNVKKNGLIIADNILLFGTVFNNIQDNRVTKATIEHMHAFNLRITDPNKYLTMFFPSDEGFTVSVKLF